PPAPAAAASAKAPVQPPAVPQPQRPAATPPLTAPKATAAPSSVNVTEEGGVKVIHAKPPIIVRDFAVALGLKPFKLISELKEMSIFASMNQAIDEAVATKLAEKHGFLIDIKHRGEAQPAAVSAAKKEDEKKSREEKAREEDIK